ncbi:MAG: zf-HC2 domain-containing protein [Terriglobia bacterium]
MDHEEALRIQAAERYLLGEMAGTELQAFEEHYFSCPVCAEALTTDAIFADNARNIFKERELRTVRASQAHWDWLRKWFSGRTMAPALAALVFLVITGYLELVTVPGLKNRLAETTAFQPVAVFALHSISRGARQVIGVPKGAQFYTIFVDLPSTSAAAYFCEIRDASGALRASITVPRSATSDTLNLLLDPSHTPPGDYTLVVRASPGASGEVGRYRFTVEFR